MSAVSMNEATKKTAQLENAKEARPPAVHRRKNTCQEKFSSAHRIALLHRTRSAEKMNWKQTSAEQRWPVGFFPHWAFCHWHRTCILPSS